MGGQSLHMAEEDEQKLLDAARQLPLGDRTAHKNWRVRVQAFDDIRASCERAMGPEDPALDGVGGSACYARS